jgi:hypothetical protein
MSDERPVMITLAPISRDASTFARDGSLRTCRSRHAGDVDDDDLGAVGADAAQQLIGELRRALIVEDTDDRQDEQPFAHLQYGRRELAQCVLLLTDDALTLSTKLTATVLAIRFAAGSYASSTLFSTS